MSTEGCHNDRVLTKGEAAVPTSRRRTGEHAARTGGRSARVVEAVLGATLEQLGASGYAALRVEDVASRAGVNKTSIYRRWPTKAALVDAALRSHADPALDPPDTGAIETDCLEALRQILRRASSSEGRALLRVAIVERADPELSAVAGALRAEHRARLERMVARAVERGELPRGTHATLIVETLTAPLYARFRSDQPVDERFLAGVVGLVLDGARARR
jgi:AcrR family transcriptional regulator